jgi:hypothetical protein
MDSFGLDDIDEESDNDDDGYYDPSEEDPDQEDDDDEDDEDDDDEEETWQVCLRLTSQADLPRLARIPGSAWPGRLGRPLRPDG